MRRFHRQTILPQIGDQGQKRLLTSKVLIIGAGGLGHPVAQYLAAMGVGQMRFVDGDVVDESNLHRQILFADRDVGFNKARVLSEKIQAMSPVVHVSYEPDFLDKAMALKLFPDFDLILDCTDNFESKFLINDVCALFDKPMVYGAISQFEGQVGTFLKSKGACYRCLYPSPPLSRIQSCADAGVVGPVVGVVGSLQALEAMKVLIGPRTELNPLFGKINFYNFCDHTLRSLRVPVRGGCLCHQDGFTETQISDLIKNSCLMDPRAMVVDVREEDEWDKYHIPGSFHLPLSRLAKGFRPDFAVDQEIVLICNAGVRAKRAQEILGKMNFRNVKFTETSVYEYQTR